MTYSTILSCGVAGLALVLASPAPAQQLMPGPTPTADALAAQMRVLASDPRDVAALISAGELSTRLGDLNAALSFFARASAIDPGNPRIAAGRAGALVALQRPGEALQLYAQAERGGAAMEPYLMQRGLAYDLVGQPGYAQRDYRRALARGSDDETVRRLALSLGISGQRDEALQILDPLLRRSDRAAWRARAFVLAMTGDVPGAQRIATSMLAGGAALTPFFGRLATLGSADRAFAVHYGEIGTTAARVTDARLAPALAPLPTPSRLTAATTQVAAVSARPSQPERAPSRTRRSEREAMRPGRTALPNVAVAPPVAVASTAPASSPSVIVTAPPSPASVVARIEGSPVPIGSATTATPNPLTQSRPVDMASVASVASLIVTPSTASPVALAGPSTLAPAVPPAPSSTLPGVAANGIVPSVVAAGSVAAVPPAAAPAATPVAIAEVARASVASPPPVEVVSLPSRTMAFPQVSAPPPPPPPQPVQPASRTPEVAQRNTRLLASIIDTIDVPASELAAEPRPRAVSAPAIRAAEPASPAPRKPPSRAIAAAAEPEPNARRADADRADARGTKTGRKGESATVEAQTAADDKAKPGKKGEVAKAAAKTPSPAKAEPQRWWVQVAGGANADDLDKDWKRLTTKSASTFRGKTAYTTPLRATNRLLTGPFKTQGEAMAFVNQLSKAGTSAFAWQSPAGQKIAKLGAK